MLGTHIWRVTFLSQNVRLAKQIARERMFDFALFCTPATLKSISIWASVTGRLTARARIISPIDRAKPSSSSEGELCCFVHICTRAYVKINRFFVCFIGFDSDYKLSLNDQAYPKYCQPACTPEFCRQNKNAVCSATYVFLSFLYGFCSIVSWFWHSDNTLKTQSCHGQCQHTSCQACRYEAELGCEKCRKDDFNCLRKFGRCMKREVCKARKQYPCKSKIESAVSKWIKRCSIDVVTYFRTTVVSRQIRLWSTWLFVIDSWLF